MVETKILVSDKLIGKHMKWLKVKFLDLIS
jgi:hypothetical protein